MNDDPIRSLDKQLNPKNMSEFQMGMYLATAIDMLFNGKTIGNLDLFLEQANESMDYWFEKYEDELEAMDIEIGD